MKKSLLLILVCAGILLMNTSVFAIIRMPAIFGDNMVLQRGVKVPIWGKADPGETIEIDFKNKTYKTTADKSGKWSTKLDIYIPGGPYQMLIKTSKEQIAFKNILIGDVWIAAGQSNMEFGIQTELHGADAIAKATDTLIHFFYVPMAFALQAQTDIGIIPADSPNGKWVVCSPRVMANPNWAWHGFSAAGYYFAQQIRNTTGVPVGMIATYKGGTPAQAWISIAGLQKAPAFNNYVAVHEKLTEHYNEAKAGYPQQLSVYKEALRQWNEEIGTNYALVTKQWEADVAQAKANGTKPPPQPKPTRPAPQTPTPPDGGFGAPANLYNAMIAPLIPYSVKGVLWYQGEGNGDRLNDAVEYKDLFPRLITDWRYQWGQKHLPFLFVQLANYRNPAAQPSEGNWPWVREAQLKALSLPETGMAVITDIGEADNIHPKNKLEVGLRLALAARHVVYGEHIVFSGPEYRSMKIEGNKIRLVLSNTGSGLTTDTTGKNPTVDIRGFGIAGNDQKFVWAKAAIENNTVVVWGDGITDPKAVRYNWADNPPGNLYNKEKLPASPFRTDNWAPDTARIKQVDPLHPDYAVAPLQEWEKKFSAFQFKTYKKENHVLPYRFYQPEKVKPGKKYPLVLFFHGAGERDTDNRKQFLRFTTIPFWEKQACFVLAPQCPTYVTGKPEEGSTWVQTSFGADAHNMNKKPTWSMGMVMELLKQVMDDPRIDHSRIYVTGLSMGGFATWEILQREGGIFAAAMPVCGGADLSYAHQLVNLPIWVFHGDADATVPVKRSRDMVAAINVAGGQAKYSEYPGVGHDAWSKTYSNPEVWDWLFSQVKK